jgi:UDP-N-acetylmuramyl pentapeptide phosphotransferase/UDP-N-acetylglucosamine-1-phosphate transferase
VLKLNKGIVPNNRSSHASVIPGFGGVSFYLSFLFAILGHGFLVEHLDWSLVFSLTIIFLTGFVDDILDIPAKLKILGIVIATLVLINQGDFYISSFHGVLGIYELPGYIAVAFNLLLVLFIVNAFNLIDGIDGLSSIIGISAFSVCLIYSLRAESTVLSLISTVGLFSLLSFLPFNLSVNRKMFMGDTGSLLIGFVLSIFILHVFSQGLIVFREDGISNKQLPIIAISILFIPIFDTFRVMLVRVINRQGVFSPDRNHIHHLLIDRGLSHKTAAFCIGSFNLLTCIGVYLLATFVDFNTLLVVFSIWVILVVGLLFEINRSVRNLRVKSRVRQVLYQFYLFLKRVIRRGKRASSPAQFNKRLKIVRNFMF